MRSILILAILTLFLASCHNEVPDLPTPEKVREYKYCEYESKDGPQCKSTYEISEKDCDIIGKVVDACP